MKIDKFKPMPLRRGPPLPQILNFRWPWKQGSKWEIDGEHMPFMKGLTEEERAEITKEMLDKGYIP